MGSKDRDGTGEGETPQRRPESPNSDGVPSPEPVAPDPVPLPGERPDDGLRGRAFSLLGDIPLRMDGEGLVTARYLVPDGGVIDVLLERLIDPAPPWPPAPGEDARARLSRFLQSFRIRVSVT